MPADLMKIEKTNEKYEKPVYKNGDESFSIKAREILSNSTTGECICISGLYDTELKTMRTILYREAKALGLSINTTMGDGKIKIFC